MRLLVASMRFLKHPLTVKLLLALSRMIYQLLGLQVAREVLEMIPHHLCCRLEVPVPIVHYSHQFHQWHIAFVQVANLHGDAIALVGLESDWI